MTQKQVINENKNTSRPTMWSRFKDALAESREKRIREAMEKGNTSRVIRLVGKVNGKTRKASVAWLGEEAKYNLRLAGKLYAKAKKKDDVYVDLFVKAYLDLTEKQKDEMWKMMSKELEQALYFLEQTDVVKEEVRNMAKIYVAVGKVDEFADHTKCWNSLKDLAVGRSGNVVETRKFTLDVLHASDYRDMEFWKSVVAYKENGHGNGENLELAKHGIKLLTKDKENEKMLLDNFKDVADKIVKALLDKEPMENKVGLLGFVADVMEKGSPEQKLLIFKELHNSKVPASLLNQRTGKAIVKILRSNDNIQISNALLFLSRTKWCPESARKELYRILDQGKGINMVMEILMQGEIHADEAEDIVKNILEITKEKPPFAYAQLYQGLLSLLTHKSKNIRELTALGMKSLVLKGDERAKGITINMLLNAEQFISSGRVEHCKNAMKLLHLLDFVEESKEIRKKTEGKLEGIVTPMLDSEKMEDNINAANILLVLRRLDEAQRLISEVVKPEFEDLASDEDLDALKRKRAEAMLKKLNSV